MEENSGTTRRAPVRGLPAATPGDEESVSAPSIPSFASLRGPRRRSPIDELLSGSDVPPEPAAPAAPVGPEVPGPPAAAAQAARPPEWVDLWYLGLRLARWCVSRPLTTARRLLG